MTRSPDPGVPEPSGARSESGHPRRNLYGRRRGKHLKPKQAELVERMLPGLMFPGASWKENPDRTLVPTGAVFGREGPVWLEIGFGSGEHLARLAAESPEIGFIGCEPYENGVASLVSKIAASGIRNIRIYPGDVRDVLDVLPDGSIGRAFLLYPDPWPKKRHHKRRFVTPGFLRPLARVLERGAEFRVATDVPDYARQTLEQVPRDGAFEWTATRSRDWKRPWAEWQSTRYETKAVENGRIPIYMTFKRI